MEHLPMHLYFDSPQALAGWLAAKLPHLRGEVRGTALRLVSNPLSSVLIKPGAAGRVTIEFEKLAGAAASGVAILQFGAICWGLWFLFGDSRHPSLIVRIEGVEKISDAGATWWAFATLGVAALTWLPSAVVNAVGRAGARSMRDDLAALFQGRQPAQRRGNGVGVLGALTLAAFVTVVASSILRAVFGSEGPSHPPAAVSSLAPPPPPDSPWRAEVGPGWTLSVPPPWERRDVDGNVDFDSSASDPSNPILARLISIAVPPRATLADARTIAERRVTRTGRVVAQREVVVHGATWHELEWMAPDSDLSLHGLRRATVAHGRLWEVDCSGADMLFDRVRPVCLRLLDSLHLTTPPTPAPGPTGYVAPSAVPTALPTATTGLRVGGVWATTFRSRGNNPSRSELTLTQEGTSLHGTYRTGRTRGVVVGSLDGATARGTWREGDLSGSFVWTFTSDGARFSGGWRGGGPSGSWSGVRRP